MPQFITNILNELRTGSNTTAVLALFVGLGSLAVSVVSVAWNIYDKAYRLPKLKIRIGSNYSVASDIFEVPNSQFKRVMINATNFGPIKLTVSLIVFRRRSFWERLTRRSGNSGMLGMGDDQDFSESLPKELEMGQSIRLSFFDTPGSFLTQEWDQVGLRDSYGRVHWVSRRNYKKAKRASVASSKPVNPAAFKPTPTDPSGMNLEAKKHWFSLRRKKK